KHASSNPSALVLATQLRCQIAKLRRRMHEHWRPEDLTPNQAAVIVELDRNGPMSISQLSRAIGVRSQCMGKIVTELEGKGYANKSSDPDDKRQRLVAFSDRFKETLRDGRASRSDWLARTVAETFNSEEIQHITEAMRLL